jgi:hypothetical protein
MYQLINKCMSECISTQFKFKKKAFSSDLYIKKNNLNIA